MADGGAPIQRALPLYNQPTTSLDGLAVHLDDDDYSAVLGAVAVTPTDSEKTGPPSGSPLEDFVIEGYEEVTYEPSKFFFLFVRPLRSTGPLR